MTSVSVKNHYGLAEKEISAGGELWQQGRQLRVEIHSPCYFVAPSRTWSGEVAYVLRRYISTLFGRKRTATV
jgi:hypothetical protein